MGLEPFAFQFGIGAHAAQHLPRAGSGDPGGHLGAALGRRGQRHVERAHRAEMDVEIDPVEQGAEQARLIIADTARVLVAVPRRIAGIAAAARVHCGDRLRAGREGDMGIGAGDIDLPGLERLAQRIEHRVLEFGQFVEEQHAQMRKADLARAHLQSAAGERCHARRMVRGAERARPGIALRRCAPPARDRLRFSPARPCATPSSRL